MNLAILGATGSVGGAVTARGIELGHAVVAPVRSPQKVTQRSDRLQVMAVDLADSEALARSLRGVDAVVFAIGTPPWSRKTVSARIMASLVAAMQAAGVRRLVAVSALGIGESAAYIPAPARLVLRLAGAAYVADKVEMERLVRDSGLDWTLVRPWAMRRGGRSGKAVARAGPVRAQSLTYADVADCIVRLAVEGGAVGQAVAVVAE